MSKDNQKQGPTVDTTATPASDSKAGQQSESKTMNDTLRNLFAAKIVFITEDGKNASPAYPATVDVLARIDWTKAKLDGDILKVTCKKLPTDLNPDGTANLLSTSKVSRVWSKSKGHVLVAAYVLAGAIAGGGGALVYSRRSAAPAPADI